MVAPRAGRARRHDLARRAGPGLYREGDAGPADHGGGPGAGPSRDLRAGPRPRDPGRRLHAGGGGEPPAGRPEGIGSSRAPPAPPPPATTWQCGTRPPNLPLSTRPRTRGGRWRWGRTRLGPATVSSRPRAGDDDPGPDRGGRWGPAAHPPGDPEVGPLSLQQAVHARLPAPERATESIEARRARAATARHVRRGYARS